MAFEISLSHEDCDKCKQPATEENPVISLRESLPHHSLHVIFIHVSCFNKSANRLLAKSKIGLESEGQHEL